MLYGYGGFDISEVPRFRPDVPAFLERGGVYATANMRGGGEYGEVWHEAGMFEKKQNVFDDFIAAAEYLVKERYASPATLGIMGGSNGGLLVGAVMEQRPDLFAVALPAVGVMDMLRYHKFSGGAAWATEYGSADDRQGVRVPVQVFAAPQPQAGHLLSGHARGHGGSRRSGRAQPLVQVRGDAAGRARLQQTDADSGGDAGVARLPSHGQADRRARGRVGLRAGEHEAEKPVDGCAVRMERDERSDRISSATCIEGHFSPPGVSLQSGLARARVRRGRSRSLRRRVNRPSIFRRSTRPGIASSGRRSACVRTAIPASS